MGTERRLIFTMAFVFLGWAEVTNAQSVEDSLQFAPDSYAASFTDMSEVSFRVEAIAHVDRIREYAICKAVWFAEKLKAESLSLSNPVYRETKKKMEGWIIVSATAYLNNTPNPDGNPSVNISDYAEKCGRMWDWY